MIKVTRTMSFKVNLIILLVALSDNSFCDFDINNSWK